MVELVGATEEVLVIVEGYKCLESDEARERRIVEDRGFREEILYLLLFRASQQHQGKGNEEVEIMVAIVRGLITGSVEK